ncbi:hypothetical protein VQH23_17910 [Pararoseomonas sp. SCSIO 73927]|uniref:hypothetical protein n=1 Tax=Pararoseomonas sp. SCSIO 73927 TaxID=3114537 RepID=UPI0030D5FA6B
MIEDALVALQHLLSGDPEVGSVHFYPSGAPAAEWQGVGLRLIEVSILPSQGGALPGRMAAGPGAAPATPIRLRVLLGVRLPDALEEARILGRLLSAVMAGPVLRIGEVKVGVRPEQGQDPRPLRAGPGGPLPLCAVLSLEGPLLTPRAAGRSGAPPVLGRGGIAG